MRTAAKHEVSRALEPSRQVTMRQPVWAGLAPVPWPKQALARPGAGRNQAGARGPSTVWAVAAQCLDGHTHTIRVHIEACKAWSIIPPKRNRARSFPFSTWLYRQRNLVERFFNRLKCCRGIATRYDKRQDNYIAGIKLIALRIWMRSYKSTA